MSKIITNPGLAGATFSMKLLLMIVVASLLIVYLGWTLETSCIVAGLCIFFPSLLKWVGGWLLYILQHAWKFCLQVSQKVLRFTTKWAKHIFTYLWRYPAGKIAIAAVGLYLIYLLNFLTI